MVLKEAHLDTFKDRLKRGQLLVGTMVSEVRNPNLAYLLAVAGFDFFIIDNEHGAYSPETISNMIAASRGAGIAAIVRIPEIQRANILKPLDSGATGLLVPVVETAEQVKEVIRHAKYPPVGRRGAALRRAHSLYRRIEAGPYLQQANEDTVIAIQIENPGALENMEKIASVKGVDALFVGPFDLSVNMGLPGQISHPSLQEAIERVVEVGRKHKLATGIQLFDATSFKPWIERGMRFISYSGDIPLLADAAAQGIAELKSMAG
jgi:2-keto-3-deoxy-L-rhamnonate aldolase RhmA